MTEVMQANHGGRRRGSLGRLLSRVLHLGSRSSPDIESASRTHVIVVKPKATQSDIDSSIREAQAADELIATLVQNTADARLSCAVAEKITYQQLAFMNNLKRAEVYVPLEAEIDWELTDLDAWCSHLVAHPAEEEPQSSDYKARASLPRQRVFDF
jgi:hypothetical protein